MLAKAPRKRASGPLHDAVDEGGADFPSLSVTWFLHSKTLSEHLGAMRTGQLDAGVPKVSCYF